MERVLITGGAGFIGSHLADALLEEGHAVRLLDCLAPQVHGADRKRPAYLRPDLELVVGDIRDRPVLQRALQGIDVVYHFAARVGVGQSMYEMAEYAGTNTAGTAVLLEELSKKPVQRLVVASSMSIYGEGLYRTAQGEPVTQARRNLASIKAGIWDPTDAAGATLTPVPTPESKQPDLASVYALTKYDQERMALIVGEAYDIPTVALRFFNVFGPRQALSNPYTGVLAIFASRLLNKRRPLVFEDGLQQRDFVSVHDIVDACKLALKSRAAVGRAINVGSGQQVSVVEVARRMAQALALTIEPEITREYRVGDVRHCVADISLAKESLGFTPRVSLDVGMAELVGWLDGEVAVDRIAQARDELAARGLTL